jgi:ABC-type transport system involved in multi-copper enzyme maturation permease subunit
MIHQIFTIGRNTFLESIRQPIFGVLILVASLLLIMNLNVAAYTMDDDNKQLLDMGLSTLFVTCIFLAAFTATGVLSQEIENKTVLTVVSKPVSRPIFVLGKYAGVAAAIGVGYWLLAIVFMLTLRHKVMQTASDAFDGPVIVFGFLGLFVSLIGSAIGNYLYHWVFTSSLVISLCITQTLAIFLVLFINKDWVFQSPMVDLQETITPQLVMGLFLLFQGLLIVTAIAITTSTRVGQVMTIMVCSGFMVLGLTSDYMFAEASEKTAWGMVLFRTIPNLHMFWPADALTQGLPITPSFVGIVTLYCVMMVGGFLSLAVALFQTREVG